MNCKEKKQVQIFPERREKASAVFSTEWAASRDQKQLLVRWPTDTGWKRVCVCVCWKNFEPLNERWRGRARERERGWTHSLGGKEVKRMERKSTRASVSKRADFPTAIPPFIAACLWRYWLLFLLRLKKRKGKGKRRWEQFITRAMGGGWRREYSWK